MIRAVIDGLFLVVLGFMKCGGVYCARRTGSVVEAVACEGVVRCHDD